MARRTFDVVDVTEILIHWHAGRSISEVAAGQMGRPPASRRFVAGAVDRGSIG
jgi:hypothetical protein